MSESNRLNLSESANATPTSAGGKAVGLRKWLVRFIVVLIAGGAVGSYYVFAASGDNTGDEPNAGLTAAVVRGPMVVSITGADSTVDVAKRSVIRNELDWPAIIEEIVPDGTEVNEGDVVIKFECTKLEDALEDTEVAAEKASLAYQQTVENLKLKRKEMDNNIRKAEQTVADTKADLAKYLDDNGEWETIEDKAESDITLAREELVLAEGRLKFKVKVNTDPELNQPYSESEIKADTLGVERLKKKVKEAESALYLLKTYDYPRQVRTRKDAVTDANLELERAKLIAATEISLAQAELDTSKTLLDKVKENLAEYKEDTELRVSVKATVKGRVVYDTGSSYRRETTVSVEVGEEISPRQQIMIIPDMSTLEIHTKIMETVVNDLVAGKTPVLVGIRAWPGLGKLPAVLKWRAPQADQQSRWRSSGTKMYSAVIELENRNIPGVWPGMNAEVELIIHELKDVLSMPIASVFSEQEKSYCWRVNGGPPERVEIVVGATNEQSAEIKSGLKEGDRVMLIAPQTSGKENGGVRSANGDGKKPEKSAEGDKGSAKPAAKPADKSGERGEASDPPRGEGRGGASRGEGRGRSTGGGDRKPREGGGRPPARRNTGP